MNMAGNDPIVLKKSLRDFLTQSVLPLARVDAFRDDESFLERGVLDSTGILELVGYIEQQFSIRVEADEITPENLDSLEKLAAFITRKTTETGSGE
jgi:acyl carrier protein